MIDSPASRPHSLRERLRWKPSAEGFALYDIAADAVYDTNSTGIEIIELANGHRTLEEIAAAIAEKRRAPSARVLADVQSFFVTLGRLGLADSI